MPQEISREGLTSAFMAFALWGVLPLFWKLLSHVPAGEQLLHRAVWAAVLMVVLLGRSARAQLRHALAEPKRRRKLALAAVVLAVNWFAFLVGVETDRVLHVSLGYYINPIVSVVLGMIFLGERLRRLQWAAVAAAGAGVLVLLWQAGEFPWLGLVVAGAFGTYGLVRKTNDLEPLPGSALEACLLAIPCIPAILWLEFGAGTGSLVGADWQTVLLLLATGPVTAIPILFFTAAAKRLPLYAVGFMQYVAPTIQFVLAVFVFGEVFSLGHALAFGGIWTGVVLFAVDMVMERRRVQSLVGEP